MTYTLDLLEKEYRENPFRVSIIETDKTTHEFIQWEGDHLDIVNEMLELAKDRIDSMDTGLVRKFWALDDEKLAFIGRTSPARNLKRLCRFMERTAENYSYSWLIIDACCDRHGLDRWHSGKCATWVNSGVGDGCEVVE